MSNSKIVNSTNMETPDEMIAIAPIIIGVPMGATPRVSRKQPEIFWK